MKKQQSPVAAKLFKTAPKPVQDLHKAASKELRQQARAQWWAANKPK